MSMLADQITIADEASLMRLWGAVTETRGLAARVADLPAPIGSLVRLHPRRAGASPVDGEVVGFDRDQVIIMPFGSTSGIGRGDRVEMLQQSQTVSIGADMLGRVIDARGRPIDKKGPLAPGTSRALHPPLIDPLNRVPIRKPLATGVRSVDAMTTLGRGQRVGIFAPPGVGKSTLLGMMARHTDADVAVVAMIGERGREVRDFIEHTLGEDGMKKTIVVCATGDEPPLLRIRAAFVACAVAEWFRDQGSHVLLMMDSVTRFCQAQRQVGLSIGEPPATKGYPPSVFAMLPVLLERAGSLDHGSITGLYAVLVEGDEETDPIADAARGVLDGHIQLSRKLANRNHWPAVDVVTSISRLADAVTEGDHQAARADILQLIYAYREVEDLLNIGAYAAGSNPEFDLAIACKPVIDRFLQQGRSERFGHNVLESTILQLVAVGKQIDAARQQLTRQPRHNAQPAA